MSIFKQLFSKKQVKLPLKEEKGNALENRVRQLEIKSKRLTKLLFTGEYHSAFKGVGMVFKEVKEYVDGDDIRFIDWNVSARMGSTYSKVFEEERERSVYIIVDASASNSFGSGFQSKRELITEIAAVLAFSAANNNDKIGLIICTDRVEKYIPPKKGRSQVLYMLRVLLSIKPAANKTDLNKALQYLNNNSRHKSIVFFISDFMAVGYEQTLRITAKKHDLIGIHVYDKAEAELPQIGMIQVSDAETGFNVLLDSNNKETRDNWQLQHLKLIGDTKLNFSKAGADLVQIETCQDYVKALQQFFIKRA